MEFPKVKRTIYILRVNLDEFMDFACRYNNIIRWNNVNTLLMDGKLNNSHGLSRFNDHIQEHDCYIYIYNDYTITWSAQSLVDKVDVIFIPYSKDFNIGVL